MKIAIDVSPLKSGHRVRGVGSYLRNLKDALIKYHDKEKFVFFEHESEIPSNIDLVHYPYFDPFFRTLPFDKKYKTVVTVHDLTPLVFPQHFPAGVRGRINWEIQKYNLKKVDRIITDSKNSKKDIVRLAGVSSDKVDVVYLAASENFKKLEIQCKYNLPDKFVLYVGDVTWNKNLPRLIDACLSAGVSLVMVGKAIEDKNFDRSNLWNKDLIRIKDQKSRVKDQIITLGFVSDEDLVAIYNKATVFAMPSLYEGFGLPILEAMQSGTPVVTSDRGSIPEVVGDAALIVDAENSESIASVIKEVFDNEKLQKELSEKGLKQAKKFRWKKTAAQTLSAYERVLGS